MFYEFLIILFVLLIDMECYLDIKFIYTNYYCITEAVFLFIFHPLMYACYFKV